jgi:hypothetical protein
MPEDCYDNEIGCIELIGVPVHRQVDTHIEYKLQFHDHRGSTWYSVWRRFRDFDRLLQVLNKNGLTGDHRLPDLPAKRICGNMDPMFLIRRKELLRKLVEDLLHVPGVPQSEVFRYFSAQTIECRSAVRLQSLIRGYLARSALLRADTAYRARQARMLIIRIQSIFRCVRAQRRVHALREDRRAQKRALKHIVTHLRQRVLLTYCIRIQAQFRGRRARKWRSEYKSRAVIKIQALMRGQQDQV